MTGHYEDKIFYILTGLRNSGKGVFQDACRKAYGNYICDCNPPIVSGAKTDAAALHRTILTCYQNIARLGFSNESISSVPSDILPVLDGNMLKIKHSGGDAIIARVNFGDEVKTHCNMTAVYTFNKIPACEPADALLVSRFWNTAFKYQDPPKIEGVKETDQLISGFKKPDDGIKIWIRNNKDLPLVMLSLIDHYWTSQSASSFVAPESFAIAKDDVAPNNTDPEIIFSMWFIRGENSFVEVETAKKIFAKCTMTINKLTRMMNDKGFDRIDKRYTIEEEKLNPKLTGKKRSVYYNIKQIKFEEQ